MSYIRIENRQLTVSIDPMGASLHSISMNGIEYLWQGDPAIWPRRDLNLFPCVGRLYEGHYRFKGKEFPMPAHGFCKQQLFEISSQASDSVELTLRDRPETFSTYPFHFTLKISYSLRDSSLIKTCRVENTDNQVIYFGMGSHPGFNVPLGDHGDFSQWYLEFPHPCNPHQICFDHQSWLLAPDRPEYALENGMRLPLDHKLFDHDAIVLEGTPRSVTLRSNVSSHSVTVDFPQMPFIGFWHMPKTSAPYVCIEPWLSLPSQNDQIADLETQENLIHLEAGECYENTITITVE